MERILAFILLLLSVVVTSAQKFVFSGSLGLANALASQSIYNRVGDPQWKLSSELFSEVSSFPYAVGIDASFEYKKWRLSSGVRYIGTNHIATFTSYSDPRIEAISQRNYFMSNIEIPLLVSCQLIQTKQLVLLGSLGASLNFNSTSSWITSSSLSVKDTGSAVGIASFMDFNQEPFVAFGTIAGLSLQPRNFLKRLAFGCYYNAQWQGGAQASIGTSEWTGSQLNGKDYNLTYRIRPSYFVFYIKYDLFDFSLRE